MKIRKPKDRLSDKGNPANGNGYGYPNGYNGYPQEGYQNNGYENYPNYGGYPNYPGYGGGYPGYGGYGGYPGYGGYGGYPGYGGYGGYGGYPQMNYIAESYPQEDYTEGAPHTSANDAQQHEQAGAQEKTESAEQSSGHETSGEAPKQPAQDAQASASSQQTQPQAQAQPQAQPRPQPQAQPQAQPRPQPQPQPQAENKFTPPGASAAPGSQATPASESSAPHASTAASASASESPSSEPKAAADANAAAGSAGNAEFEKIRQESEEFKRKWYSVTAEYDNYRKRTQNTKTESYQEGRADIVKKLFAIGDNLDRAIRSCQDETTKKGINMVLGAFDKLLEAESVTVVNPVGQPFDPKECEAIMAVDPKPGQESGIVTEVYVKGYVQNGKVLRYAQVIVTK